MSCRAYIEVSLNGLMLVVFRRKLNFIQGDGSFKTFQRNSLQSGDVAFSFPFSNLIFFALGLEFEAQLASSRDVSDRTVIRTKLIIKAAERVNQALMDWRQV